MTKEIKPILVLELGEKGGHFEFEQPSEVQQWLVSEIDKWQWMHPIPQVRKTVAQHFRRLHKFHLGGKHRTEILLGNTVGKQFQFHTHFRVAEHAISHRPILGIVRYEFGYTLIEIKRPIVNKAHSPHISGQGQKNVTVIQYAMWWQFIW